MNDPRFKKIYRRQKIRETVVKVAAAAKDVLAIYTSVRQKDPISVGLGVMSAYTAIDKMLEKKNESSDFHSLLIKAGLKRVFSGTEQLIYKCLLEQANTPKQLVKEGSVELKRFDIDGVVNQLYVIAPQDSGMSLYAQSEEFVINYLSGKLPQMLQLGEQRNAKKYWESYGVFSDIEIPIDSCYEVSHEQTLFINRIIKFFESDKNRSSLLLGPPGTGKTTFAVYMAKVLKGRLLVIDNRIIYNLSSGNMPLDTIIRLASPTIILLDDVDRVGSVLDNLLLEMEQWNRIGKKCVILGTANDLAKISEAARRPGRFDEILTFDLPDIKFREKLLRSYTKKFGTRLSNEKILELAFLSEGLSPAFLKEVALQATVRDVSELRSYMVDLRKIMALPVLEEKK